MKRMLIGGALALAACFAFAGPSTVHAKEPSLRPSEEKTQTERGPRRYGGRRHRGRGSVWIGGGGYWGPRYYAPPPPPPRRVYVVPAGPPVVYTTPYYYGGGGTVYCR